MTTRDMVRLATAAMGTRFELVLLDGAGDLRAAGEAAIEEIEHWHRRLSRFAPDSFVSHINRTAASAPVPLDLETCELFEDALRVWRASDGAFDVTVAVKSDRDEFQFLPPRSGAVAETEIRPGRILLDTAARTIRFADPAVSIDLGGIAKGHALDCAAALLLENGVTSALLHGGTSSVVAIGSPPDADGWAIALGPTPAHGTVALRGGDALSVSDAQSQRSLIGAAHIVDPRSGIRVEHSRQAAVVGPSARVADAWSTALVALDRIPAGFPAAYTASFFPGDD